MGKNDPKSPTGLRERARRFGEKLGIRGLSRSTSPVGNIEGRGRASSAPPSPSLTNPRTRPAQISASPFTTVTSPLPLVQVQTVDATSASGSSHSPIASGLLQTPPQDIRANIEDVIKELESAKADIKKRQWKYTNRHGETVIVVERIGRILKGVQKYTAIVSTAIQHSPETTALVWAGVRVILQVALNHVELMENLELAMATIIDTMATCEFYAHIYMTASLEVTVHSDLTEAFKCKLDSALKALYDAISAFTAEVKKYFGSSTSWTKNVGNLFKPFSVSMQPLLDEIASKERVIRECAEMATMKRIMESSNELKQMEGLLDNIREELKLLSMLDEISTTGKENLAITRENLAVSTEINAKLSALVLDQRQTNVWKTLDSEFEQLRKDYLAQHQLEVFELDLYIPAEGMMHPHDSNRFDLLDAVRHLISDAVPQKICLIQGAAGSGKSTFNHHLARQLWHEYDKSSDQATAVVPVFIPLFRAYRPGSNINTCDLIAAFFTKQGFLEDQILLLRRQRRFVFILDGYDEIERRDRNFYTENELDSWNAKVIITTRPEYLPSGYQSKFYPPGQSQLLQEYFLAPFSKSNIQKYISQYVNAKPECSVKEYEQYISKPDVSALISNPFLLRMTMAVRPAQSDTLKRVDLYEQFVDDWLKRAHERLNAIQLREPQRNAYNQLEEDNFSFQARHFCQQFALALYRQQTLEATYAPIAIFSNSQDQSVWKHFLANDDIKVQLLRLSSPLIRQGNLYRFLHKSLRDYLVAEVILKDEAFNECKANALMNEFHLVNDPGVLDFITEKAWLMQHQLLAFVERSKTDTNFDIASANAITVLVRARKSFTGYDLRSIRIPRADLSGGFFHQAQLQNANLCQVRAHQIWFQEADLSKASMNNVSFGERPFIQGHSSSVERVAFSPDGQLLASGNSNCTIRLWSVPRHETVHTFEGHRCSVQSVAFSPDGQLLASGSVDHTIRLWSVPRHETVHTFEGHNSWVQSVAFSPDGQLLASSSDDRTIRLWSVPRHETVHTFEGHSGSVQSVAFSPDGQLLASGSDDCTIRLWSVPRHETVHTFEGHSDSVCSVAFSPDGQLLASGSSGVHVWQVQHKASHMLANHSFEIACLWAVPQRRLILTNVNIQDVTGLDSLNFRLLGQRGAVGQPVLTE